MNRPESTLDSVKRSSGLLTVAIIGLVAFLIVSAILVGWLLWKLGRVVV
jgi:hypothetical protein